MKIALAAAVVLMLALGVSADSSRVEFDDKTDFATFKTFRILDGQTSSQKPEINSLTLKKVAQAIREGLLAKALKETQDRPDLTVSFRVSEQGQRGVVGRGIRNMRVVSRTEGTLVIEMARTGTQDLLWSGVYADDEDNATKLASKLPDDAKKLIAQFPPKKKK